MNIRRKARSKPWMAKKKGRDQKPFEGMALSTSNPLYKTARWRATREHVLQTFPICYWCESVGWVRESTEVDHVISSSQLNDVNFFDQDNLVGSCRGCNLRRASYCAKGVYYETKEEWREYLSRKRWNKKRGL